MSGTAGRPSGGRAPGDRVARGAVVAVARSELRRRGITLIGLGLVIGLVGAVTAGSIASARRTATAFGRLEAAAAVADASVLLFDRGLALDIAALPEVEAAWDTGLAVALVDGPGVFYTGWRVGPAPPAGLARPVVVAGREADPTDPHEVVIVEDLADALDLAPGDELRSTFLAPEEVAMFDTGFGEPDGPTVTTQVVGILRVPGMQTGSPVLATPAFSERYGDQVTAGRVLELRLRRGAADLPAVRAAVDDLAASSVPVEGAEEFAAAQLSTSEGQRAEVGASARVLVVGLAALAGLAAVAGLVAAGHAFTRHHARGAADQRVEAELGLTAGERTAARVLAAGPAAVLAGFLAGGGALVGGLLEPPGGMRRHEPVPGWAPNIAVAALAAVVTAVVVVALAAVTAHRAGTARGSAGRTRPVRPGPSRVPLPVGAAVGVGLALAHPRRAGGAPTRSSIAGVVLGVTGLVAAMVFTAGLDRLVAEPSRWGWNGDVAVVDTTAEIDAELLADPRVEALTVLSTASVSLDGGTVEAQSQLHRRRAAGWTVLEGGEPVGPDEIVVGTRVARRLGLDVGDSVDGGRGRLHVVGVGIGPTLAGGPLGDTVLLSPDGLARHGVSAPFNQSMLRATAASADALVADVAAAYEVEVRSPPPSVANLADLGVLPTILGAVVGVVGSLALAHALVTTVRRRHRDLAVLRVLGCTPRQAAATVVAMAAATATIGVAVGVPTGLGLGRLVWWVVASANGAAPDAAVPVLGIGLVALGAVAAALVVALVPARAAARVAPGVLLRDA